MANEPVYECTNCERPEKRERLTVKKVSFMEMGVGGRMIKSRVVHWLCPDCVRKDPDFNREPFRAPNNKRAGSSLEKLRG